MDLKDFYSELSQLLNNENQPFETLITEMQKACPAFKYTNNAEQFLSEHGKEKLLDLYRKSRTWTVVMNKFMLPYIVSEMGYIPQNEYYRIDVIGYTKDNENTIEDTGKSLGLKYCTWDLRIAIEHENKRGEWLNELIKLTHINCPIRIVIGYNRPLKNNETAEIFEKECIEYFFQCLSSSKSFLSKPYNDNPILLLFGQRDKDENWTSIKYNAYELQLETKSFIKIV